jgi:hypothetical protein
MPKLFTMYAGPGAYGPKVQIQSVFGDKVWCKFSQVESTAGARVVYQYWSSDTDAWKSAFPGQVLNGQSVYLAAKSLGTGGNVVVSVEGSAIKSARYGMTLHKPIKTLGFLSGEPKTTGIIIRYEAREVTPVDDEGNPTGPPREINVPDPDDMDGKATIEMVDDEGNPIGEPIDIPDQIAEKEKDESQEAPKDEPNPAW